MKKVLVLSIPHTGTEFVTNYLGFMDIMPLRFVKPIKDQVYKDTTLFNKAHMEFITHPSRHVVGHMHIGEHLHLKREYDIMDYAKEHCKVIIPLRHPLENAISYIGRHKEIKMLYCANNWSILLNDIISNYEIFWIDINIAKRKRLRMMKGLNRFIEREPMNDANFIKYIKEWKPVNHHEECDGMKEAYYTRGELPKGYDVSCLDTAIKWYNNKHTELEKLYE
jgi:hypothetical protein